MDSKLCLGDLEKFLDELEIFSSKPYREGELRIFVSPKAFIEEARNLSSPGASMER